MLLSQIYFLPCIVSLLWFVSFILKKKSYRQGLFCCAEGFSVAFYAVLGIYFYPDVDYDTMVKIETIGIPTGLLFPVFLIAYMYMHYAGKRIDHRLFFLFIIPAIVVGVAVNLLSFILGFEQAAQVCRQFLSKEGLTGAFDTELNHIYCLFRYHIFRWLEYTNVVTLTILCFAILRTQGYKFGDVSRFFFRGKQTTRSRTIAFTYLIELAIMASLLTFGRVFISEHVIVGIFLTIAVSAIKHIIAYLEFYSDDEKLVTLYELSHLTLFYGKVTNTQEAQPATNENQNSDPENKQDDVVVNNETSKVIHPNTPAQIKMDKRIEQFRELMEEKKIWMDEDLTAQTICDLMSIGKTTLSMLIAQQYDSTLRDVVNQYRIDEAKAFMAANPKVTQEIVAQHCGFKNASYFNALFKKIVGDTPAMWLAGNNSEQ